MYDVKSESFQELQNKRRSLPSQLTIIPNMAPIVRNLETKWDLVISSKTLCSIFVKLM